LGVGRPASAMGRVPAVVMAGAAQASTSPRLRTAGGNCADATSLPPAPAQARSSRAWRQSAWPNNRSTVLTSAQWLPSQ
jgi:hypothetical protein